MALKEAIKEYIYLISILEQLNIQNNKKHYLFTDSQSAIELANNPEHHAKSKHIDIQYHFVRENIQKGIVELSYIPTKEQIADLLTKGINSIQFKYLSQFLKLEG